MQSAANNRPTTGTKASALLVPGELLSRAPDVERDNLVAADATDRLLIDLAAESIRQASPSSVAIIGDRYGALTLNCLALGATAVRVHQDSRSGELALAGNYSALAQRFQFPVDAYSSLPLGPELVRGAEVVLLQLPKSLDQLNHWAALIAQHASASARVFAGGRIKHMTRAMNEVLERHFNHVQASLAKQKSRALIASQPRTGGDGQVNAGVLTERFDSDLQLWVCSSPGVFAADKVDGGTRYLAQFLSEAAPAGAEPQLPADADPQKPGGGKGTAIDLGCGTGVLAALMVREFPDQHVVATDRSAAAVISAQATLERNFPAGNWEVRRDHALASEPDASADLIVCNPPFHQEASISVELADLIFRQAARVLKPGGVMLTVFNSHLPHRRSLARLLGPTEQLGRNPRFTVTRTVRR